MLLSSRGTDSIAFAARWDAAQEHYRLHPQKSLCGTCVAARWDAAQEHHRLHPKKKSYAALVLILIDYSHHQLV